MTTIGPKVTSDTANYRKHQVKKNESLWKIAKNELGSNASNAQIQKLSNEIARLNKLDTPRKRNCILINSILYLPQKANNTSSAPKVAVEVKETKNNQLKPYKWKSLPVFNSNYGTKNDSVKVPYAPEKKDVVKSTTVQKHPVVDTKKTEVKKSNPQNTNKTKPEFVPKTNAEKGFKHFMNGINTNAENLRVEKAFLGSVINMELYHIYSKDASNVPHLIGTCKMNNKGELTNIYFEGDEEINRYAYDYAVDKNGAIYKKSDMEKCDLENKIPNHVKVQGHIPKEIMNGVKEKLETICN